MPKRLHHRVESSVSALRPRVEKALQEGRTKQALELAKQLFKDQPTRENSDLTKQAYLARARDLSEHGAKRDAANVLRAALAFDPADASWKEKVGNEFAHCGSASEILALAPTNADPATQARLLGHAVDAALSQGTAGRTQLPAEQRVEFDFILQAFAQAQQGQDDAARASLTQLGLRSPFLEWKLLLRGLLAYYAHDDARALENWQRMSANRLPSRLAAPLRQAIDPAYRGAQSPAAQARLTENYERLQGTSLLSSLRSLRAVFGTKESLAPAFRQAETLLPALRRDAPALADRLANCFYWAILETGPADIPRFRRIFGAPPIDPNLNRLEALGNERGGEFAAAHRHWQQYEQEIAANTQLWPPEQAAHARALIWLHMGENAAKIPSREKLALLPTFMHDLAGQLEPLKPSAEQCYRRAIELAPDLRAAYEKMFDLHKESRNTAKAAAAARRLLERFPDDVATLEAYADLCAKDDEAMEALALYQRALRANPLDRQLRDKTATAHLVCARIAAAADQFDAARREVQAAATLGDMHGNRVFLSRAAAVEFKAGDAARGEEYLTQAREAGGSELALSYRMLTEAIRLKLPRPLKAQFETAFAAGLSAAPDADAAAELVDVNASLSMPSTTYYGQKAHTKKILAYLDTVKQANFSEAQMLQLCRALMQLDVVRLTRYFFNKGQKKFPRNPYFPYLEARSYFQSKALADIPAWKVQPLLRKTEKLARALPEDEQLKAMLDDIDNQQKALSALNPFAGGMFGNMFENLFGSPFEEDDDEFDEDEDDEV